MIIDVPGNWHHLNFSVSSPISHYGDLFLYPVKKIKVTYRMNWMTWYHDECQMPCRIFDVVKWKLFPVTLACLKPFLFQLTPIYLSSILDKQNLLTQIHSPNIIKHLNMKKFPASQGHILLFYKTQWNVNLILIPHNVCAKQLFPFDMESHFFRNKSDIEKFEILWCEVLKTFCTFSLWFHTDFKGFVSLDILQKPNFGIHKK